MIKIPKYKSFFIYWNISPIYENTLTTSFELSNFLALKHREPKSTAGDPNNIVIDGGNEEIEVLDVAGVFGVVGGFGDDADVGELAVVGGAHRVEAVEVEGVGVKVIARLGGDAGGGVPGLDVRVVVGAHLVETLGVLVDEGGVLDGVGGLVLGLDGAGGHKLELAGGVVRPFTGGGAVAYGEVEGLDSVREADIVAGLGVGARGVGGHGGGLHLLDQDITGGTGHLLTLIVGHDGVVGPDANILEVGGGGDVGEVVNGGLATNGGGDGGVDGQDFVPVAEGELDSHIVIGQGGSRQSDTRVPGEEEGEGHVEGVLGEGGLGQDGGGGLGKDVNVTNHILVTLILALGEGEGGPEVEVVVVEASGDEVVEGDAALLDKVMTHIVSPANKDARNGGKLGESAPEPGLEEVVTSAGDGDGPVVVAPVEVGGAAGA